MSFSFVIRKEAVKRISLKDERCAMKGTSWLAYCSGIFSIDIGRNCIEVSVWFSVIDVVINTWCFAAEWAKLIWCNVHWWAVITPVRLRCWMCVRIQISHCPLFWLQRQHKPLRSTAEQGCVVRITLSILLQTFKCFGLPWKPDKTITILVTSKASMYMQSNILAFL